MASSGFISYLPQSLLSPFLASPSSPASHSPSLLSYPLSFLSSTTSTALSFLSLTPTNSTTGSFSFSLGSWNQWWNAAVEVHPALFGFGGGKVLEWLCFACRVMAYVCTGPFAFLILLDLTGYVLARTLHVPPQRVRVRPVPSSSSSNPSITTSPPDEPIPIAFSSGVSSAINVHPLKSPSTPDGDGSPEIMLRGLSSSSSISSAASSVAGDSSPSAGLGLGLEGVGSGSGVKMAGKVASGESGSTTTRRRIPGSLSISPLPSTQTQPLSTTSSSSSYNINTYPLSSSSSSSASSSITSSPVSRFMTTPGERHAILPPSRDLSPEPSSIPLPADTDEGDERLERRRRRAASIGVEGALGFMEDDDDEEESEGEGKEGALRTRRGTIRPGEGREE